MPAKTPKVLFPFVDKIEYWPIDQFVIPNRSDRHHPEHQKSKIMAIIQRLGQLPIMATRNGRVIDGQLVIDACRALGRSKVAVLVVDMLNAAEADALRIAYNTIGKYGEFDDKLLGEKLSELLDLGFQVDELGFEIAEADLKIQLALNDGEDDDDISDTLPQKTSLVQEGDLFEIGPHKILCADCRDSANILLLISEEIIVVCVTDPPYNVPNTGHVLVNNRHGHGEFAMAKGEMSPEEFQAFLGEAIASMQLRLKKGGLIFSAMDWRGAARLQFAAEQQGMEHLATCVWVKKNAGMGSFYRSQHEFFLVFRKPGAPHINNIQLGRHGRSRSNVWNYAGANSFGPTRDADLAMHPTVKPTSLIEDILYDCTGPGDIVFDPFGGSGTTLIAAQKTKRVARVIELDPCYVETALRRYEKRFKTTPTHVETGLTLDELIEHRQSEASEPIVRTRSSLKKGAST